MCVHISIWKPTESSEGTWLFKGATQGPLIIYASIIGHSENPYDGSAKWFSTTKNQTKKNGSQM